MFSEFDQEIIIILYYLEYKEQGDAMVPSVVPSPRKINKLLSRSVSYFYAHKDEAGLRIRFFSCHFKNTLS